MLRRKVGEIIQALSPHEALNAERERRNQLLYIAPPIARKGIAGELVLASDQFIITPTSRIEDAARAHAAGDENPEQSLQAITGFPIGAAIP